MSAPLELIPVGTGAAYARPGEAQSCYLLRHGGRHVVLDLGAGALNRLQELVPPHEVEVVAVTHLHPDHMIDLLSLRVYMAWGPGRGRPMRVVGPAGLRDRLSLHGDEGLDAAFHIEELAGEGGTLDLGGGMNLRYRQVPHLAPTYAMRLDVAGSSVCFGSDCAPNGALVDLAGGVDVLLCECSYGADPVPEGVPHLNATLAASIARDARAGRLLLTHCYPEHDRDVALAAARAGFPGPVEWAVQGTGVTA